MYIVLMVSFRRHRASDTFVIEILVRTHFATKVLRVYGIVASSESLATLCFFPFHVVKSKHTNLRLWHFRIVENIYCGTLESSRLKTQIVAKF